MRILIALVWVSTLMLGKKVWRIITSISTYRLLWELFLLGLKLVLGFAVATYVGYTFTFKPIPFLECISPKAEETIFDDISFGLFLVSVFLVLRWIGREKARGILDEWRLDREEEKARREERREHDFRSHS